MNGNEAKAQRALLIDLVQCIGCFQCVKGCMETQGFEGDARALKDLSANAYTLLLDQKEYSVRNLCRHCIDPACVSVCPVTALRKTVEGPVIYEADRCIGCRYCMVACPFDIPRYEWDKAVPAVQKCDMCIERQREGEEPACAVACEVDGTTAGTREELLEIAHERIAENPENYHPHVFGEHEVGGTLVMYLAPKDVVPHGFERKLGDAPLPQLTWQVLNKIPGVAVSGAAILSGIWWITRRREEVAAAEAPAAARKEEGGDVD